VACLHSSPRSLDELRSAGSSRPVSRSRAPRALGQWRRSLARVKGRRRVARDSNCTSSGSGDRTVTVPSPWSATLVGTCISRRSRSPGSGGNWSSSPCSSRANGCRATLRSRRTKSATSCVSSVFATPSPLGVSVGLVGSTLPAGGDNSPQPHEQPGLSDATPSVFLIFLIVAEKRVRGQRPGGSRPEMRSVVRVRVVASQVRNL